MPNKESNEYISKNLPKEKISNKNSLQLSKISASKNLPVVTKPLFRTDSLKTKSSDKKLNKFEGRRNNFINQGSLKTDKSDIINLKHNIKVIYFNLLIKTAYFLEPISYYYFKKSTYFT